VGWIAANNQVDPNFEAALASILVSVYPTYVRNFHFGEYLS
jgi:hypothetical protein